MTSTAYQASEAQMASACASRVRPGVGISAKPSVSPVCAWLTAAQSTKTATRMFVDVPNHRTRRLWEPSQ